jgi:type I restriction enzyme R subunit
MIDGVFRRRNLPHIDLEGKATFITACLEGSISAAGLKKYATIATT